MNIKSYLKTIKDKVEKIDSAIGNPIRSKHKSGYNPFSSSQNKTYVWVDKHEKRK